MGLLGNKAAFSPLSEEELAVEIPKKNYLIIGGTAGIGKALAESLLKRNAAVTIVGRRSLDSSLSKAVLVKKDLSLMKNARELADEVDVTMFDVIVFTNGIISQKTRVETADGIEQDLAVSYLSRLAFLKRAVEIGFPSDKRKDTSRKPRVFIMGYPGKEQSVNLDDFNSEKEYKQWPAHMNTVVGNEALVYDFGDKNPLVNVYALNPGLIKTDIRTNVLGTGVLKSFVEGAIGLFCKSAGKYSESVLLQLMVTPDIENTSKLVFECDGSLLKRNPFLAEENQLKVVKASEELLRKAQSMP